MSRKRHLKGEGLSWTAFRAEWLAWYAGKREIVWFGLKFGVLVAAFYALLLVPDCERLLYIYLEAYAWLANAVLNVLGQGSQVTEVTITSPHFSMAIRRGCDAVEPTWLFCAAVLSYPAPLGSKAVGILVGIVVLQVLNLIRILSLYVIGVYFPIFFNTAHVEIWPVVFIVVAIVLMVGWIDWTRRHDLAR
jgi:exosortase/archaeosortase family protein